MRLRLCFKGNIDKVKINLINMNGDDSNMEKYVCTACGYVYDPIIGDPDAGIAPGTSFEDIPEDWVCPTCGVGKDMFEKE